MKNEQKRATYEWALNFYRMGYTIFPVFGVVEKRCTCGNLSCASVGKHPMYKDWQKSVYFKGEDDVRQFWQLYPYSNYGVLTNGLVVIDIDERNGGWESFEKYVKPHGNGIETFTVLTGSGGNSLHIYFLDPTLSLKSKPNAFQGIDIKATGGYVVGPYSVHQSGNYYQVKFENFFSVLPIPEPLKYVLYYSPKIKGVSEPPNLLFMNENIQEGGRNNTLASYAGTLVTKGVPFEEIRQMLLEKNKSFLPPLDQQEVLKIAESISRYSVKSEIEWKDPDFYYKVADEKFDDIPDGLIFPAFYKFVMSSKKSIGVPASAIMVSLMTFVSAILGAAFRVKPSKNSSYSETLNTWGLIVAPPSSRKTSILGILTPALMEIDEYYKNMRSDAKTEKDKELSRFKSELNECKKDSKKRADLEFKILELKNRDNPQWCFFTSDSTPESLGELFKFNQRGVFLIKDELDGLLNSMNKQGYELLRSILKESWNGAKPFRSTRIMRGIVDINSVTLSILGGVQPDILSSNFREELQKGLGSDGLLARFQLSAIYDTSDLREPDTTVNTIFETYDVNQIFRALHEKTKDYNLGKKPQPSLLYLSEAAYESFNGYQKKISKALSGSDAINQAYLSHIGKFARLVLSLSGQFHVIDSLVNNKNIENPIEKQWVDFAIKWANHMDTNAKKLYFSLSKNNAARVLTSRIRSGDIFDGMSVRAIYRKRWAELQNADDVLSAIEAINSSNWIMLVSESPKGGGRKTDIVRINPQLIEWLQNAKKQRLV